MNDPFIFDLRHDLQMRRAAERQRNRDLIIAAAIIAAMAFSLGVVAGIGLASFS